METTRAIVADEPPPDNHVPGSNWHLRDVVVSTNLRDGEVLVEMVAVGICHTDLALTSRPAGPGYSYPRIAGHEGAGKVVAIGPNVTKRLSIGEPVLLSYDSCMACAYCHDRQRPYCPDFMGLNLAGQDAVFANPENGTPIAGKFFGQSSFARLSVCKESTILSAINLLQSEAQDLALFCSLGCGLQTGAGSVLNTVQTTPQDRVMILGLGGVGLAALMGAKIAGAKQIIGVDRFDDRLELAKSFGATHALNTSAHIDDLAAAMRDITDGLGPTIVVDTTGVPPVIEAGYASLAQKGTFVVVGGPKDPGYELKVNIVGHLSKGAKLVGCVEGDSVVEEFVPKLVEYYRAGKFPIDKITKFYPVDEYKTALDDLHKGAVVKAVLLW